MKRHNQNDLSSKRGSAMIAGVFIVLVVSVMSMSYLQLSLNKSRENASSVDAKRAFYMAEAGLAEGYAALVAGKSGVVASPDQPAVYANGVFWVEATPVSATRTQLRSTGISGTGRDSLTVVVERTTRTLAEYGVFGDEGVQVSLGASIESYDSRLLQDETPSPVPVEVEKMVYGDGSSRLRVGSNQDITFVGDRSSATTIDGDAIPGPAGSVVIGPGVSISGSTAPADSLATLNAPALPDTRDGGTFVHIRAGEHIHEPALCNYDRMAVTAGKVVIKGPAKIVVGDLQVSDGAELSFDTTDGPVRLYVTNEVTMAPGSILSSVKPDPTHLMLVITAADQVDGDGNTVRAVQIRSGGEFHGFIYSPDAELRVNPNLDFHGSVIGKRVVVEAGATLKFDEALLDVLPDGSSVNSDMISWRFVQLPDEEVVRTKIDPIKWMMLKGRAINKPSETHDEDWDGEVDAFDIIRNKSKELIVN